MPSKKKIKLVPPKSPNVKTNLADERGIDEEKDKHVAICPQQGIYAIIHDYQRTIQHQAELGRYYAADFSQIEDQVGSKHFTNYLKRIKTISSHGDEGELNIKLRNYFADALNNQEKNPHFSRVDVLSELNNKPNLHILSAYLLDMGNSILEHLWAINRCPLAQSLFFQKHPSDKQRSFFDQNINIMERYHLASCNRYQQISLANKLKESNESITDYLNFLEEIHAWDIWQYYGSVYSLLANHFTKELSKEIKQEGKDLIVQLNSEFHKVIRARIDKLFSNFPTCHRYICLNDFFKKDDLTCENSISKRPGLQKFYPKSWTVALPEFSRRIDN